MPALPYLVPSKRIRRTPFTRRTEAAGVRGYSVYNRMLLPKLYRSMEEDYHHLKSAVQVWDVACERQIEIVGPDARPLVQMATPRDISGMKDDQCYYIPAVDAQGRMLNDPVLIRLANDRYWVSIADSDLLLYYDGLAAGAGLDVRVFEPDVSPLAIQGPKSEDLIRRVFGDNIAALRFFRHKPLKFQGKELIISRSGYSVQGGFEIYVNDSEHAEPLWDTLFEAGQDLDVRPGYPHVIERIEGGLMSYGDDFTMEHTPFEAGLGKFCDLDKDTGFLGRDALMSQQEPVRTIRPVEIEGSPIPLMTEAWRLVGPAGEGAGQATSAAWSPGFETNVSISMVNRDLWEPGTELTVEAPDRPRKARVREKFWR